MTMTPITHTVSHLTLEPYRQQTTACLKRLVSDPDIVEGSSTLRCASIVLMEREGIPVINPEATKPYLEELARCMARDEDGKLVTAGGCADHGVLLYAPQREEQIAELKATIQDIERQQRQLTSKPSQEYARSPWLKEWRRDSLAESDAKPEVFKLWHPRVAEVWPGE
jgi:hypothetical protein